MPSKQELVQLEVVKLAVLCQKVADAPSNYTETGAAKAFELKKEWMSLQSPPERSFKEEQKKQAQLASLKNRMADFLAGIL